MFTVSLSALLAAVACVVNFAAAIRGPFGLRMINGARGALAGLYVGSYLWLLAHLEQRAAWSRLMTGTAIIVWIVVWIVPPLLALRLERKTRQVVDAMVSR